MTRTASDRDARTQAHADPVTIVSADSHAGLPPQEYRRYLDPGYREYTDVLEAEQRRFFELIRPIVKPFDDQALAVIDPYGLIAGGAYDAVWDMNKRLAMFDAEGIAGSVVIFGAQGAMCPLFGSSNEPQPPDVRAAMAGAYNRWLAEFCGESHGRMAGLMVAVPHPDCDELARTIEAGRAAGMAGVMMSEIAGHDRAEPALSDPFWEPMWAACADLAMPICIHAGFGMAQGVSTKRLAAAMSAFTDASGQINYHKVSAMELRAVDNQTAMGRAAGDRAAAQAGSDAFSTRDIATRRPLWELMWSGVFDRHPALQLVFTEVRADWIPATLAALDALHARRPGTLSMKPSEYWARNCSVGAAAVRPSEIAVRHRIGVDRMMFGTDFPHPEGTFPNTLDWIRRTFDDVAEAEARQILGENAMRIYGLDRERLDAVARRVGPAATDLIGTGGNVAADVVAHWDLRSGYGKPAEEIDVARWSEELAGDLAALGLAAHP